MLVGTSTITSDAFVGGNLSVGGTFTGTLALGNLPLKVQIINNHWYFNI